MLRFFFYGTLLDADVRRAVFPHRVEVMALEAAGLSGYRRVRAVAGGFPLLRRANGARVEGLLVEGFDRQALLNLAHFEGAEYLPRRVTVAAAGRRRLAAWTFLAPHGQIDSREPWELRRWQLREKPRVMRQIDRWFRDYGAGELHSIDMNPRMRRWILAHLPDA